MIPRTRKPGGQQRETIKRERDQKLELYEKTHPEAARWAAGCGAISHSNATRGRVFTMVERLADGPEKKNEIFELLSAADQIANAAMWLVVHATYAKTVRLDGRDLQPEDFKENPNGHTGGSLNMVPAYVGYHVINAITGLTRGWIMGQGHCVAAIDAVNLLLDNMTPVHEERYSVTEEGMNRFVRDFYSFKLGPGGKQESPLGSHVTPLTAGGMTEGGYLGFVELQYVHMPLPGERLVVFLSDGAFEEQRGSDWASRWWRAEDCGLVAPLMIYNGRRIDQKSTVARLGGTEWLVQHLELNGFDPFIFDGRDPAAFAWSIHRIEQQLQTAREAIKSGKGRYPVSIPYGIAVAPKGAGFFNEGTNRAHNLPLEANPREDAEAAREFNESAGRLWIAQIELQSACRRFQNHEQSGRARERDHPLVRRRVELKRIPEFEFRPVPSDRANLSLWACSSPMDAVDGGFLAIVQANPFLRPRVGSPDEMHSNRMNRTLQALKFRVSDPEEGVSEDIHGSVISALNEEAVAAAALANKGGINLVASYEAFAAKMHGVLRQEITFAKRSKEFGRPQEWLSVPFVLTSHTWENGKNGLSHQDPAMTELMLNEPSDLSRVLFAADFNTASVMVQSVFQTRGQYWTMVVPKAPDIPDLFSEEEARVLLRDGAMKLEWAGFQPERPRLILTAIGAYQLGQVLKASRRLAEKTVPHSVIYMMEPGRFRSPRDAGEQGHAAAGELIQRLYPRDVSRRLFVSHTRPEPMIGALEPLNRGRKAVTLGFINQGGTLDTQGMLCVNRCTWGHIVIASARLVRCRPKELLSRDELKAAS